MSKLNRRYKQLSEMTIRHKALKRNEDILIHFSYSLDVWFLISGTNIPEKCVIHLCCESWVTRWVTTFRQNVPRKWREICVINGLVHDLWLCDNVLWSCGMRQDIIWRGYNQYLSCSECLDYFVRNLEVILTVNLTKQAFSHVTQTCYLICKIGCADYLGW